MKRIIQEILRSEQKLNLRDKSNRRYITGLIMEAIRTEGWYLDIGTHRATSSEIADHPMGVGFGHKDVKSNAQKIEEHKIDGIEYSEFAHLSTDHKDEVKYDGDGNKLEHKKVKSYGFFKNEYYDD